MQIDTFLYLDSLGFIIFSLLIAKISIKENIAAETSDGDGGKSG
jgi:hypothetical protein